MDRFDFVATSLTDLISTRYFSVPRYQRSYAWDDDQVADFWNDMQAAIKDGGDYFLGNIVLTENPDKKSFAIIDGQQRIATTTLLNAAIRDLYAENGEAELASAVQQEMLYALDTSTREKVARIRLNDIDSPFYRSIVVDRCPKSPETESHKLILKAYQYFRMRLDGVVNDLPKTWQDEFGKIAGYLKSQSRVVSVYASNDADAFTIFETLNDRGIGLSIADLLKNYLYSRSGNEIDTVQTNWIETRTILEEYQEEIDFLIFLRHYWSSVHGMTREKELYRSIKSHIQTKPQAVKLSLDLKNGAKFYAASLSERADFWSGYSETDRNNVKLLLRLKLEQNRPLLIAVFQHFPKEQVRKTIPALVSWSVRGLIGGVMGKGAAESTFCEAAVKVRSGKIKTKDELGQALSGLIPRDAAFEATFASYRTRNNAFARYLLLAIERHMCGESQPEYVPNENVDDINLEHVLPQKAKKVDWPTYSPDEVNFHSYRLGNMTLLQERKNNALGNQPFATKKPVLSGSKMHLNKVFGSQADWSRSDIESRQMKMSSLAPKVWKL